MIDLGFKAEKELEDKRQQERLDKIAKEFIKFANDKIVEHQINSMEYIAILNSMMAGEIRARLEDIKTLKVKQNLEVKKKITKIN